MTIPVPTFVRIEYWNPDRADWVVGHAGMNLLNPQRYVEQVLQNSRRKSEEAERKGGVVKPVIIARAIDKDTDIIYQPEEADLL